MVLHSLHQKNTLYSLMYVTHADNDKQVKLQDD